MNNSISSIERPLFFFQDLISYKSLETMIKSFRINSPFEHFDKKNLVAYDYEFDEHGGYIKIEDKFDQRLLQILQEETLNSIKLIDQSFRPNLEEPVTINKVKNVLDILYSLDKGISKSLPSQIHDIIHQSLIAIIRHIFTDYEILGIVHPSRNLIRNNKAIDVSFSFFGAVRENFNFYRKLHSVLYENDIIPESDENDDVFFELLISEKPQNLGIHIKFSKSNRDIVLILRALSPFFKNFNFKTIGESQCFVNKNNKILNENDLYNALSETTKYYNENPQKRQKYVIQEVISWVNNQKSNCLIFKT